MTLTVCVGASGSGKTTFLNDVHKSHKCTYIRQYHNLRPYIAVSSIPNFDPTKVRERRPLTTDGTARCCIESSAEPLID
jgi:tRNA uridine 5-carbamoylmethylation protein Kti12